ncbi:DsbA family protein [Pengzhenrongella sp.]|jgi:protein-disulfide isomerase|uniref:DsbA family protein n=1 Tax=Pengzhenrongella sp. TaxID=2888820 RepID=UPI002F927F92
MPSNTPRVPKAQQRDAARQKAAEMRAVQEKRARRTRILSISGLVVALGLLAFVIVMIFAQRTPAPAALDPKTPLKGVTAPATAVTNGGIPVGKEGAAGTTSGKTAAGKTAATVAVYYDYMCPVCGNFEKANEAPLDALVKSGDITLEYHPISILDRLSQNTQYSTRSAQAAAYVADADPKHFVAFSEALYANQPTENSTGLSNKEIEALAVKAEVPKAVANKLFDKGGKFTTWVQAATKQGTLDGVSGTPTVFINGTKTPDSLNLLVAGPLEAAIKAANG